MVSFSDEAFVSSFLIRIWLPSRMRFRIRFIHEKHLRIAQLIWVRLAYEMHPRKSAPVRVQKPWRPSRLPGGLSGNILFTQDRPVQAGRSLLFTNHHSLFSIPEYLHHSR
jgi:hypothetical protein